MSRRCVVLAVVLGACAAPSPPVIPFRGFPPAQILLAPAVGTSVDPAIVSAFDRNLRPAIERRGYWTVPIDVAKRMLDDLDWNPDRDPISALPVVGLREQFGVEAVLATELIELHDAGFAPGTVRATWRVYEAVSGDLIWETELVGSPRGADRYLVTGPIDGPPDVLISDEIVLGRYPGSWTLPPQVESVDSFAAKCQHEMVMRLPVRRDDS